MRICFIHDLLRSGYGAGDADRNGSWLHALLAPILIDLGHDVRRLSETEPGIASTISGVFEGWGRGGAHAEWARAFSSSERLPAVSHVYAPLQQSDFVIGYELTPNQIWYLAAAGIAFLDVSIDPIRFASDLFLRMRTNDERMLRTLEAYEHTAEALLPHVALLRSTVARLATPEEQDAAVLFVGQTDIDGSLISGAELASVVPYVEEIRRRSGGRRLLLKPHPYGRKHHSVRVLREAFASATIVNDPIYALISAPSIEHVITLSSGVSYEARLIGKPTRNLIKPDTTRENIGVDIVSGDYRIGLEALSPGFWRSLGGSMPAHGEPQTTVVQNGALRRSVGQSWGYVPAPRMSHRGLFHGQALSFATGGNGLDLCTLGWSHSESSGIWSDGPLATMLVDTQGETLDLAIDCAAFVPRGHGPLRVGVGVTGTPAAKHCFTFTRRGRRRLVIRLPAFHKPVEIVFEMSGVTRPIDAGYGRDMRSLGVRLIKGAVTRAQDGKHVSDSVLKAYRIGDGVRAAASIFGAAIGLS